MATGAVRRVEQEVQELIELALARTNPRCGSGAMKGA